MADAARVILFSKNRGIAVLEDQRGPGRNKFGPEDVVAIYDANGLRADGNDGLLMDIFVANSTVKADVRNTKDGMLTGKKIKVKDPKDRVDFVKFFNKRVSWRKLNQLWTGEKNYRHSIIAQVVRHYNGRNLHPAVLSDVADQLITYFNGKASTPRGESYPPNSAYLHEWMLGMIYGRATHDARPDVAEGVVQRIEKFLKRNTNVQFSVLIRSYRFLTPKKKIECENKLSAVLQSKDFTPEKIHTLKTLAFEYECRPGTFSESLKKLLFSKLIEASKSTDPHVRELAAYRLDQTPHLYSKRVVKAMINANFLHLMETKEFWSQVAKGRISRYMKGTPPLLHKRIPRSIRKYINRKFETCGEKCNRR